MPVIVDDRQEIYASLILHLPHIATTFKVSEDTERIFGMPSYFNTMR